MKVTNDSNIQNIYNNDSTLKANSDLQDDFGKLLGTALLSLYENKIHDTKTNSLNIHEYLKLETNFNEDYDPIIKTLQQKNADNDLVKAKDDINIEKKDKTNSLSKKREINDMFSQSSMSKATNIITGQKATSKDNPDSIKQGYLQGRLANLDFEQKTAKFYFKPQQEKIFVANANGEMVELKCIEMTPEERKALLGDLEKFKVLYLELQQLKAEEKEKKDDKKDSLAKSFDKSQSTTIDLGKSDRKDPQSMNIKAGNKILDVIKLLFCIDALKILIENIRRHKEEQREIEDDLKYQKRKSKEKTEDQNLETIHQSTRKSQDNKKELDSFERDVTGKSIPANLRQENNKSNQFFPQRPLSTYKWKYPYELKKNNS